MQKPNMQPVVPQDSSKPFSLCGPPPDCCPSVQLSSDGSMLLRDISDDGSFVSTIEIKADQIPRLRAWMDAHKVGV